MSVRTLKVKDNSPGAFEQRGIGIDGLTRILKLVISIITRANGIYNRQLTHASQVATEIDEEKSRRRGK